MDWRAFCQYSLPAAFQPRPPGAAVAGKGHLPELLHKLEGSWRCLGRSEQTSPSQAFLELTLRIRVLGRASERSTGRVRAFLPAAAEYLLAESAMVSFCSLPLFASLISDTADL